VSAFLVRSSIAISRFHGRYVPFEIFCAVIIRFFGILICCLIRSIMWQKNSIRRCGQFDLSATRFAGCGIQVGLEIEGVLNIGHRIKATN
jgi:hypothetical protein